MLTDASMESSTHLEFNELRDKMLKQDPELREMWERSAFARAVANEVLRYRVEHGLTQSALARKLGVSQPLIGRLELGEHEPKFSTLQRLSRVLGLTFTVTIHPVSSGTDDQPAAQVEVTIQAA
jgi:DNA-binding XRE family transcriptional regulator